MILLSVMIQNVEDALRQSQAVQTMQQYQTDVEQLQTIQFPFAIAGTTLIAERTAAYDGPYLEDGSGDEVTQIAALVLRNKGAQTVARTEIVIQQGIRRLVFRAEMIPPDTTVLVLEANKSPYRNENCSSCSGLVILDERKALLPSQLEITVSAQDCVTVKNLTDRSLTGIQLYHKGWLEPPGISIGGLCYSTHLGTIAPGESRIVYPEHFADGYSRILMATAE